MNEKINNKKMLINDFELKAFIKISLVRSTLQDKINLGHASGLEKRIYNIINNLTNEELIDFLISNDCNDLRLHKKYCR